MRRARLPIYTVARRTVSLRAVEGQAEVVTVRCRVCRQRRPADAPTALLRLVRTPEGRWQVDRWERLPVIQQPWVLGVSLLGDPRWGIEADPTQLYPVPVREDEKTVSCRWCDREPLTVKYDQFVRLGRRALARGFSEVDR